MSYTFLEAANDMKLFYKLVSDDLTDLKSDFLASHSANEYFSEVEAITYIAESLQNEFRSFASLAGNIPNLSPNDIDPVSVAYWQDISDKFNNLADSRPTNSSWEEDKSWIGSMIESIDYGLADSGFINSQWDSDNIETQSIIASTDSFSGMSSIDTPSSGLGRLGTAMDAAHAAKFFWASWNLWNGDGRDMAAYWVGASLGTLAGGLAVSLGAPGLLAGSVGFGIGYFAERGIDWLTHQPDYHEPPDDTDNTYLSDDAWTEFVAAVSYAPSYSPIVLDLDGDGIETVSVSGKTMFDLNNDGVINYTGWAMADDGFLGLDRNGNTIIDDGTELFGNYTVLANGQIAPNGFEALRELDTNSDKGRNRGQVLLFAMRVTPFLVWQGQCGLNMPGRCTM